MIDDSLVRLGTMLETFTKGDAARTGLAFVAVAIVAAALMLCRLGTAEICSSNEAVEGLVVQQMVEHGELLFPQLNASAPMYKPPLFHWTATALARLFGTHTVTELTLRLPSVVYGVAGVVLTMLFMRAWLGGSSAVLAGLVLIGSYQYVAAARFGRVDMALTFCETLALFSLAWWLSTATDGHTNDRGSDRTAGRTAAHYGFALALGLGVLAKGPVALVIPLLATAVFLALERRWCDLRALCSPGPALVLVAVTSSWYAAAYWSRHFDLLDRQLVTENISRFLGTGGLGSMPPWYYLRPLLFNSIPFSLVVPFAVVQAFVTRRRAASSTGEGSGNAHARLLAVFWVVTVSFFSMAAYKRRTYLLPLWPAAAALLVWWAGEGRAAASRRWWHGAIVASSGALIVFNLVYVPHAESLPCRRTGYRRAGAEIKGLVPRETALYTHAVAADTRLLFYLDRTVPTLNGALVDAPPGFVLVPEEGWARSLGDPTLRAVLAIAVDGRRFLLVESAPTIARNE